MSKFALSLILVLCGFSLSRAQVWSPDNGDGTYRNPIIYADYSDPDVLRVGDDYYMVASSFTCAPGIPVLHSKDLVNWTIVNHVYTSIPLSNYERPNHGQGSWAPSIRYHDGKYMVYFCTPKEGLFVAYTDDPRKEWTLKHIVHVAQWEDPCPFWDDDGKAYLVHSKLCGGPAILHRMSDDGLSLLDDGRVVYWDEEENPVLEGLKMMKRNGWYYILAPAGGVANGWQSVLRSRNIYGPYESRKVLEEGNGINGPHQGGLVDTPYGEWWFIHFQSTPAFGRIVHLQPARWEEDWPLMGVDCDNDGCGEPVLTYRKPRSDYRGGAVVPQTSDDFSSPTLGKQWQWMAAPQAKWYSLTEREGYIRLFAASVPEEEGNLNYAGNLLLQKTPAPNFRATAEVDVRGLAGKERCGLIVMGNTHTYLNAERDGDGYVLYLRTGKYENCGFPPVELASVDFAGGTILLRADITEDAACQYSYSLDGERFEKIGAPVAVETGQWIGAKIGIFCINPGIHDGSGHADFARFEIGPLAREVASN